jgi:hypothetical protein
MDNKLKKFGNNTSWFEFFVIDSGELITFITICFMATKTDNRSMCDLPIFILSTTITSAIYTLAADLVFVATVSNARRS